MVNKVYHYKSFNRITFLQRYFLLILGGFKGNRYFWEFSIKDKKMKDLQNYFDTIESALSQIEYPASPDGLYAPVRYELSLGGKRIRPLLALLATEMFCGDYRRAINPAVGLEVFHNFTLLHDDVMDKADVRRGKPTVHKVWDENTAILSGDAMEIIAFRYIARTPAPHTTTVLDLFINMALGICEGQQYDMEFETRDDVTEAEYIEMIRLKTAILLGTALKIGAIVGDADEADADRLYRFGESLGLAFQLQDDWLDVYGDPARFGKNIGGDILNNKKTYMLINAQRLAQGADAEELDRWLTATDFDPAEKIAAVTALYTRLGVGELCLQQVDLYSRRAMDALREIGVEESAKQPLYNLAVTLMNRDH